MMRFFAALRTILALDKASRGIAAIAAQVVKDELIPRLQEELKKARSDRDRARITALISDYEKYVSPGTPEYRDLENTAEAAVVSEVKLFGLSEDFEDEATSMVVYDFFVPAREGGKDVRKSLAEFSVERNQRAYDYTRWFSRVLKMRVHWRLRELIRKNPAEFKKQEDMTEDESMNPLDRLSAPGLTPSQEVEEYELGNQEVQMLQIKKQMGDYVKKHSRDDTMRALYDSWIQTIERRGPALNLKRDVYPALAQTYNISDSGLNERFMDIKRLIERFFREELGVRLTDALKKKLHIGTVEVLTFECFRRKFAAWMLGVAMP
jgi:hypothetical protein